MVGNKEIKYSSALERCRRNIQKTKGYIEHHKKMLRIYEAKEGRLVAKLEDEKLAALKTSINKNGLDLDAICNAVATGKFGIAGVDVKKKDAAEVPVETENVVTTKEDKR